MVAWERGQPRHADLCRESQRGMGEALQLGQQACRSKQRGVRTIEGSAVMVRAIDSIHSDLEFATVSPEFYGFGLRKPYLSIQS